MNKPSADFAAPTRARVSTAEFLRMLEADVFQEDRVELIDGEIERMQRPKNLHAARQAQVVFKLATAVGINLVRGETGVVLNEDVFLVADATLLCKPVPEERWLVAADLRLLVEIAETTLDRDLGMKRRKYAAAGVPNYWVVDGGRSVIHIFSNPRGDDFSQLSLVRFGEPLAVPGTDATIVLD